MRASNILIARPTNSKKLNALIAVMKGLDIKYELSPYDPKFVDMVLQGDKDIKEGKGKKITKEDLDALWK